MTALLDARLWKEKVFEAHINPGFILFILDGGACKEGF